MFMFARRDFLAIIGFQTVQFAFGKALAEKMAFTFGYSTYAMKNYAPAEAIREIGSAGFESLELCLLPGWPTEPAKLDEGARKNIRQEIQKSKLQLTALMEHLVPTSDANQANALEKRVKLACQLAKDLNPQKPPLLQTVLGSGDFEKQRPLYEATLKVWAEIAVDHKVVLAIKPHRFGAMTLPSQAVSLIETIKSPWLKIVYDPSHLMFRGIDLHEELKKAGPYLAHVAIKDAFEKDGKVQFDYPGATGKMDYKTLFKKLNEMGFHGDVNCEISSMISSKADYNASKVMKASFENVSKHLR